MGVHISVMLECSVIALAVYCAWKGCKQEMTHNSQSIASRNGTKKQETNPTTIDTLPPDDISHEDHVDLPSYSEITSTSANTPEDETPEARIANDAQIGRDRVHLGARAEGFASPQERLQ